MPRGIKKTTGATTELRNDSGASVADNKPADGNTQPEGRVSESPSSAAIPTISPIDLAAGADSGSSADVSNGPTGGTRRGRKPGSRNRSTETQTAEDLTDDLKGLLYGGHCMLAALAKCPEFELEEEEAKRLADASMKVMKHYSYTVNPKTLAWCQLGFAGLQIYGPRVAAIMNKKPGPKPIPAPAPAPAKPVTSIATVPAKREPLPALTNPSQLDNSEPIDSFGE